MRSRVNKKYRRLLHPWKGSKPCPAWTLGLQVALRWAIPRTGRIGLWKNIAVTLFLIVEIICVRRRHPQKLQYLQARGNLERCNWMIWKKKSWKAWQHLRVSWCSILAIELFSLPKKNILGMPRPERKRQYEALRRAIHRGASPQLLAKFQLCNDTERWAHKLCFFFTMLNFNMFGNVQVGDAQRVVAIWWQAR